MPTAHVVDLSHVIESGMITHPGLPAPYICDFLSREESHTRYAEGTEFHIGRIDMVANTGTYIDSPFHRFAHGADVAGLQLQSLVDMECLVVRIRGDGAIDATAFSDLDVRGKAVLVHTGWDAHWGTERYLSGNPFLTERACRHLVQRGAALVGTDSLNVDSLADLSRPAHTTLLGADVPIVEHMCNLGALPETGARFFAAPVAVRGMGTFPVRAFALLG
ncbi:MAG: putative cyclase [Gemmatimonadetes bacterium]|nr:putative cyclase [Gemmatimonadota bacterium]